MKKVEKICMLLLFILIVSLPIRLKAQAFDDDVSDNPVPIDGGVSLLIAAGIAYGLNKAFVKKGSK